MGSIINEIKSRQIIGQPEPVVGMGATLLGHTDRHPLTIVQVTLGGKFIKVQQDDYKRQHLHSNHGNNGTAGCEEVEMSRTIQAKEVAKIIRKRLKATFPSITFGVRTRHGNAVDISWIDGPTTSMVDAITKQYQGSGFDGSIDMAYYIDHWLSPDGSVIVAKCQGTESSRGSVPAVHNEKPHPKAEMVHFGSSFVSTSRDYTIDFKTRALGKVRKHWYFKPETQNKVDAVTYVESSYGSNLSNDIYLDEHGTYLSDLVGRELRKRSTVMPVSQA